MAGPVEVIVEEPIATHGKTYDDRDALATRVRAVTERHHTGW